MRLTTKRLILRDITPKDAKDLVKALNNIEISKWLSTAPYPYTLKDAKNYISTCLKNPSSHSLILFIELKDNSKIIGAIVLKGIDSFQGTATLGYWLTQEQWGKGIMKEAAMKVLEYAFKTIKLRRINVEAFAENDRSNNLIRDLGFTLEGKRIKISRSKADGKIHDDYCYGLLKENWKH